jgi:DNA-directed RNA polymerase specialized sigma54-like protein
MALDLNSLNTNKKSVIRFSEKKERTLAPFERAKEETPELQKEESLDSSLTTNEEILQPIGTKTKPPTQEEKTKEADKKWEEIETKTDRLIEKAEKKSIKLHRTSLELGSYEDRITMASHASFRLKPTKLDYLYLMGNPLLVLNYVISNLNEKGYLDSSTDEMAKDLALQEHTVKNVVSKLGTRGFLNCRSNPGSKRRILVTNPSILSI